MQERGGKTPCSLDLDLDYIKSVMELSGLSSSSQKPASGHLPKSVDIHVPGVSCPLAPARGAVTSLRPFVLCAEKHVGGNDVTVIRFLHPLGFVGGAGK